MVDTETVTWNSDDRKVSWSLVFEPGLVGYYVSHWVLVIN